jgi:sulfane dehydrogenase subunit SoxC
MTSKSNDGRMDTPNDDDVSRARRSFLGKGAALLGGAVSASAFAAESGDNLPPHVPAWMKREGHPLTWNPYGLPSEFEKNVVRRGRGDEVMPGSGSLQSPLQDLRGMITPNGLVFERSHAGIPNIDPAQHRLMVHGLVKQPKIFTMEDLVRFPSVSRIHFLECSGNGSREFRTPFGKSVQITHGLLSCCEWTGVLLSTILDEVGLQSGAKWVLAEGADSAAMTRSVPMEKCLEDAMLVYGQNGEMLRPQQGYPLRLFLPGFEGNMSVKWLRRLKVGAEPFMTREETSKYTDTLADGSSRQFTFMMETKSVITYPAPDHKLKGRGFYEISGVAWSGKGRIKRVDVSTDGGANWREAQLQAPVLHRASTRFRLPWNWNGADALLQSRAIDESGYVQPTRAQLVAERGLNSGYHYNAIQSWKVTGSGEVTNVHA